MGTSKTYSWWTNALGKSGEMNERAPLFFSPAAFPLTVLFIPISERYFHPPLSQGKRKGRIGGRVM